MTLKRPHTQQLQERSFIAIRTIVNQMNCEFRRHEPDNAGIDGEIDLVKNHKFLGKILKCQIKAGPSYISSENEDFIKVKVEKKYLDIWNKMNIPVVLFYFHEELITFHKTRNQLIIKRL